jgi:single-stranded-DNA-specific exonuclease
MAQVLFNRGLRDMAAFQSFTDSSVGLPNPFIMDGVADAVSLIRKMAIQDARVVVYGDYDVDGVTAAAVVMETLEALGMQVEPYIPSREDEGYGLNKEAIESLATQGARLLITVDCGIRSREEIAFARRLGLRVIVTDHHHPGPELPPADVVINPKCPACSYDFTQLAGVGVAFKLAQGLLRSNNKVPLPTTRRDLLEEDLLDLVALGTVADMVHLVDENHLLVARGLEKMNVGQRPGLSALMRIAGVDPGKVTTKTIGFVIAPRLNAAGRLDEALTALKLLLAPDMASALPLAQALDELNMKRREITSDVREAARESVLRQDTLPPLIFAASSSFPSGVVGLAASRLLDEFYRPSVVVSIEGDYSKGSARSVPEFHITRALDAMAELLERHGGHRAAAGFTVRTDRLEELRSRLTALAEEELQDLVLIPTLQVDANARLDALSWDLYHQLERLQPFGFGNPVPVFASRRVRVISAKAVGREGRHLKLLVADATGRTWDAIAFRQGYWDGRVPPWIDLAYMLERNEWNGRVSLQLNVQDIRPAGLQDWQSWSFEEEA